MEALGKQSGRGCVRRRGTIAGNQILRRLSVCLRLRREEISSASECQRDNASQERGGSARQNNILLRPAMDLLAMRTGELGRL